jgi:hypothetical protein
MTTPQNLRTLVEQFVSQHSGKVSIRQLQSFLYDVSGKELSYAGSVSWCRRNRVPLSNRYTLTAQAAVTLLFEKKILTSEPVATGSTPNPAPVRPAVAQRPLDRVLPVALTRLTPVGEAMVLDAAHAELQALLSVPGPFCATRLRAVVSVSQRFLAMVTEPITYYER